jgi:hypothetical protein
MVCSLYVHSQPPRLARRHEFNEKVFQCTHTIHPAETQVSNLTFTLDPFPLLTRGKNDDGFYYTQQTDNSMLNKRGRQRKCMGPHILRKDL